MTDKKWMLYGANGYTGALTAEMAVVRGMKPILAGRSEEKVRAIAMKLDLDYRVFSLDDRASTEQALADVDAVVHHAGPFSATSRPMVDACLKTGTHYLDITGEIAVFEAVLRRDDEAKAAGVSLLPGVGFDVVPTDCMAAMLKNAMPDANRLELAFAGLGAGTSKGTTKTVVEGLGLGGAVRINGKIQVVPSAWKFKNIPFPTKSLHAISIPWGDVSTAYYSTEIPNITVYMAMPPKALPYMKRVDGFSKILQKPIVQRGLKKLVEWRVEGPSEKQRRRAKMEVWGEVRNVDGDRITGTLRTPEGYELTADSSLVAVERVLAGEVEPGAKTPSLAFGAEYVKDLDGVEVFDFVSH